MDHHNYNTVPDHSTDRTDRDDFSYNSSLSSTLSSPPVIPLSPSPDIGSIPSVVKIHHARYFIKDDMTVFLVNDEILFRMHRHYLDRESDIFRSYPSGTEDNPIPLPGVLPEEFEALVEYFYDGVHGNISRSNNEWSHLLSISTRFKMEKIRQRAITELENFGVPDPVEKIILAVKHSVPAWLEPAHVELCQRGEPIRSEEAERLGLSIAMKLARAREYVRDPVWVHQNPAPAAAAAAPSPRPRSPQPFQSIGWNDNPAEVSHHVPSPIDKRLDTAHVKRVVRLVFWPHSPSTPESKGSPWTKSDADEGTAYSIDMKASRKKPGRKK